MIDKQSILTLYDNFEQVKNSIPLSKHKYIHSRTVDNFIFHLDKIFNENEKQKVYQTLSRYFAYLNETRIEDAKMSEKVFIEYIHPLIDIYSDNLDFHLTLKPWIVIIVTLVIVSILYYFKASIFSYSAVTSVFLLLLARHFYFQKRHKLYSMMY